MLAREERTMRWLRSVLNRCEVVICMLICVGDWRLADRYRAIEHIIIHDAQLNMSAWHGIFRSNIDSFLPVMLHWIVLCCVIDICLAVLSWLSRCSKEAEGWSNLVGWFLIEYRSIYERTWHQISLRHSQTQSADCLKEENPISGRQNCWPYTPTTVSSVDTWRTFSTFSGLEAYRPIAKSQFLNLLQSTRSMPMQERRSAMIAW